MPEKLKDLAEHAIAGDMTKEEKRVLGNALFRYGWRLALFAFVLWSFGGFARWGLGAGFAIADAQNEQTEKRVQAAVGPFNERLTKIESALTETISQTKALSKVVIGDKAKNIEDKLIETKIRWCKADTQNAKDYFGERMRDYQREYRELTRETPDFVVPTCADLVTSK